MAMQALLASIVPTNVTKIISSLFILK